MNHQSLPEGESETCRGPGASLERLCQCRCVACATVEAVIRAGERRLLAIGQITGAGTGCGTCKTAIARKIRAMTGQEPDFSVGEEKEGRRGEGGPPRA